MVSHFKTELLWQSLLSALAALDSIAQGLSLEMLLGFLEARDGPNAAPLKFGLLAALCLGVAKTLGGPIEAARRRSSFEVAMRIKSILSFEIFSKVLRHTDATSSEDEAADDGRVQALLTVDAK